MGQAQEAIIEKTLQRYIDKSSPYYDEARAKQGYKYGEAMMGRARVGVEKGDVEPAEKALRDILGDKSYPPESKAEANALLGEIFFKQQKYPEAFNSFQRLYLSFQKFPAWVARGYLRAGETKEALNKPTDAREVYKQAVEGPLTEKIKGEPDFEKIKTNLRRVQ